MKTIKNLFIIDDDEIFVFLTMKIIETTGLVQNIKVFKDGDEAIGFLKLIVNDFEQLPDVILLDLSMPIMDGWEFLEEYILLKPSIEKDIKLYLASSSISPYDIERAKGINVVSDFLIKPFQKERFIEILKNEANFL